MNQSIIEKKLEAMGMSLPKPLPSAGSYKPYVINGALVFISGQVSVKEGNLICGQLGADLSVSEGQEAARYCMLAVLSQLKEACEGNLDHIEYCIRLGGFINAASNFKNHPEVLNGASDLLINLMGNNGYHSRVAVGASSLPRGCAIEIEATFQIK